MGLSAALKQLRELEANGTSDAGGGFRTGGRQVGRSDGHAEGKQRKIRERATVVAIVDVIGVGKPAMGFAGSGAKDGGQTWPGSFHRPRAQDERNQRP